MTTAIKKDTDGLRLLKLLSMPRNPTKGDARLRIRPEDAPDEAQRLYAYCKQDVLAEAAICAETPELTGEELEFYLCDAEMNARGVQIDRDAMEDCIAIVEDLLARCDVEMRELTGGMVGSVNELDALKGWLGAQEVRTDSLDAEHLDLLIEQLRKFLPKSKALRALEIRQTASSSSVKKLYAMRNQMTRAGRLHDLFTYHGARTGRVVGRGPQPTNLPTSGPPVHRCGACEQWFGTHRQACPWCGVPPPPGKEPDEWGFEAARCALGVIRYRSVDMLETIFGHALDTVAGCLRALFIAGEGCELIGSDYNSIEAVVAACVAGEQWRIDLFRANKPMYLMGASRISGVPLEEMLDYRKRTGKHHPLRKMGKVSELACFSPDTRVLTERGLLRIVDVLETDRVWDGIAWTTHKGVVEKGVREVIKLDGVRMTPTHPISIGRSWKAANELASNPSTLALALEIGSENLPSNVSTLVTRAASKQYGLSVPAEALRTKLKCQTFGSASQLVARLARLKSASLLSSIIGTLRRLKSTAICYPTQSTAADCLTDSPPQSHGATARARGVTPTMEAEALRSMTFGARIGGLFYSTSLRLTAGITRILKWTESTWTRAMSRGISALLVEKKTCSTNEAYEKCKPESKFLSSVYDIAFAGPLERFTIKTDSGWLLVHNSPYGGWVNSWVSFGAGEFMTEDEIKQAVIAWRDASPAIVHMWGGQDNYGYGLEGAAVGAVLNPGAVLYVIRLNGAQSGISYQMRGDALYCRLPSGRELTYHRPRLERQERYGKQSWALSFEGYNTNPKVGSKGWIRIRTYGGRLFENVCQAIARDILRPAIVTLERHNYPLVMQVYDEVVCEVPTGCGSLEEVERIMGDLPEWCRDWPIRASGGWRGREFRK